VVDTERASRAGATPWWTDGRKQPAPCRGQALAATLPDPPLLDPPVLLLDEPDEPDDADEVLDDEPESPLFAASPLLPLPSEEALPSEEPEDGAAADEAVEAERESVR
jgi:hypothetical protein